MDFLIKCGSTPNPFGGRKWVKINPCGQNILLLNLQTSLKGLNLHGCGVEEGVWGEKSGVMWAKGVDRWGKKWRLWSTQWAIVETSSRALCWKQLFITSGGLKTPHFGGFKATRCEKLWTCWVLCTLKSFLSSQNSLRWFQSKALDIIISDWINWV